MKTVLIGFGKVAKAIINNFEIDTCLVRELSMIDSSGFACRFIDSYLDIPKADLYIISVVDNAVEDVVENLCRHIPNDSVVAHTSGSVSIDVISNFFENSSVIYPLYPFANPLLVDFSDVPIFLESTSEISLNSSNEFLSQKNCVVEYADSVLRSKMHVSAVFTCNFVNHVFSLSEEYLVELGCDPKLLDFLLKQTVENILSRRGTVAQLQTGPAVREDSLIVDNHIAYLSEKPNMQNIYKILTNSIITQKNGNKKL